VHIAKVTDQLSIEIIPDEKGRPSVIWIRDSAEHAGHWPTLMLDPSEVQPLLDKLSGIVGIAREGAHREPPRSAVPAAYLYPLEVEVAHQPPPAHMGIEVAVDELPLVLIHRSSGPETPPNVVTLRLHDIDSLCDALEEAYEDFRAWGAVLLYNKGTRKMQRGQYDEAIPVLKQAILMNPQHNLAVFNLAMCYDLLGRTDDAWPLYQRAMNLDPSDPDPVYNLAEILLRKNQLAQAEMLCGQALGLFQKRFENTQRMPSQIPGESLSKGELLADISYRKAVAHHLMAIIQANEGKMHVALESVQHAVSIYPSNAKWWLLMSQLHHNLGNQAEAQEALTRAIELDSDIARKAFEQSSR